MSDIQVFNNEDFGQIRAKVVNDDIWWVAKDVCDILDYSNSRMAVKKLDNDEKGVSVIDTPGGKQEMVVINEFGLYNLVLSSNKPEARKFKRWITHEVIPSIRKTGSYSVEQQNKPANQYDLLRSMVDKMEEIDNKATRAEKQSEQAINEAQDIRDTIIETDEDWRNWVNEKLNTIGFQTGDYKGIRQESYEELEDRARCRLGVRLDNLKERKRDQGATKTELNNTRKLDVIEQDKRLKEIYTAIVKELAVKHSA